MHSLVRPFLFALSPMFLLFAGLLSNPHCASASQVQESVATAPSLDNLKSRAEDGDAKAQFSLAVHYLRSNPAAPDYGSAIYWLRASASQGHTQAHFFLGCLYHAGEGI